MLYLFWQGYESRPTKISLESITSDSRNFSSSTSTEHTKTFLNSHTRVTSAQDVISRMKNAEKGKYTKKN